MKSLQTWIDEICQKTKQGELFECGHKMLSWCVAQSPKHGLILEFGVFSGSTISTIALSTSRLVYGLDGFFGLGEEWNSENPKGKFNCDGVPPFNPDHLPPNTKLVIGLFEDTLEDFLRTHEGPIAFIHIDCDLYKPAKFVLDKCGPLMSDGCAIVFNEFTNYENASLHEFRAFTEWLSENDFRVEALARTECSYAQNAFRVFRN